MLIRSLEPVNQPDVLTDRLIDVNQDHILQFESQPVRVEMIWRSRERDDGHSIIDINGIMYKVIPAWTFDRGGYHRLGINTFLSSNTEKAWMLHPLYSQPDVFRSSKWVMGVIKNRHDLSKSISKAIVFYELGSFAKGIQYNACGALYWNSIATALYFIKFDPKGIRKEDQYTKLEKLLSIYESMGAPQDVDIPMLKEVRDVRQHSFHGEVDQDKLTYLAVDEAQKTAEGIIKISSYIIATHKLETQADGLKWFNEQVSKL